MALFGRTKQQAQAAIARTKDRKGRRRVGGGSGVTPPVSNLLPINSIQVNAGDSIMAGTSGTSAPLALASTLAAGGRMRYPLGFNNAVSGQTSADTSLPANIAAIKAMNPKVLWLNVGTNDPGAGLTATQTQNNINAIITGVDTADYVIVNQVLPRDDTNWNPTREAVRLDINSRISAMASSRVKILTAPPSFNINTHCLADKLHLNDAGADLISAAYLDILNTIADVGDIRTQYLDPSNIFLASGNVQLTGVGGSKSGGIVGDVADLWTAAGAMDGTMSIVASKVADFNGAIGQRFTISGTPATAGRNFSFSRTVTFSGAIGEKFEGWIDFQLAAGHTGFRNPGLILGITGETSGESPGRTNTVLRTSGLNASGAMRTYCTGTLTAPRTSVVLNFVSTFDLAALNVEITVGRPGGRKVV